MYVPYIFEGKREREVCIYIIYEKKKDHSETGESTFDCVTVAQIVLTPRPVMVSLFQLSLFEPSSSFLPSPPL